MRYTKPFGNNQWAYPSHDINPDEKNASWCMAYAKAAYYDWNYGIGKAVFAANGGDYEKYRMYSLGKQPVNQYKKWMGVDQQTNNTQLVVDWTIRPVLSGYRDKAISRLMKNDFGVVATAVDSLAKTELDDYIASIKSKLAVRSMLIKQNPELANHPLLSLQAGEPRDVEELEMRVSQNEQFNRSKDAELTIALGFYENEYNNVRRQWYEDLFDWGVAGFKDWLGDDHKAKFRRVDCQRVIVSDSNNGTFNDIVHAGEEIDVSLVDLATVTDEKGNLCFTDKELQEFAGSIAGKFGNPTSLGFSTGLLKPIDKFRCKVLDIEFFTYNEDTYTNRVDANGNIVFRKEKYGRGEKDNIRYVRKKIQYVYKCKWIIGTDKCYDWGMCYDQKRSNDPARKSKTKLSYNFCAYNFYQMRAQGYTERLVPYADAYQLALLKIQNFLNRAVPSGWWIDLTALENVAMNKGGKNMTPKELLQMFFETGVLMGRSVDAAGNPQNPNWKPVIPIENTAASEIVMYHNELISIVEAIEKMTGYNMITSGNPNPKTLSGGYDAANQATDDALYPMAYAEEYLTLKLAESVFCRMQQGVKKGKISGYAPYGGALNGKTLKYMELSPSVALRDYGIMLQQKSTQEEKMWLMQNVNQDIMNGFLDTSDAILIINTHNAKEAMQILAYRVKKAKESAQQNEMQKIQMANEGNMQSQQMAQQAKMQELNFAAQLELEKKRIDSATALQEVQMKVEADTKIRMYEMQLKYAMNDRIASSKEVAAAITGDAKIETANIAKETTHVSDMIKGQADIIKQKVANQKPVSSSSK